MNNTIKRGFSAVLTASLYEVIGQDDQGFDLYDYVDHNYEFDYLDDVEVSSSVSITSQPTLDGDYIADHLYRNPVTERLVGSFALNGNAKTQFGSDRLTDIENIFERIMNEGASCTIVKRNNSGIQRFKVRDNMILTSISWTESQNTLGFSFDFTEAIKSQSVQVEYNIDVVDTDLPSVSEPKAQAFTDSALFSKSDILKELLGYLSNEGILTAKNWKAASDYTSEPTFIDIFQDFIAPLVEENSDVAVEYSDIDVAGGFAIGGLIGTAAAATAISVMIGIAAAGASVPVWGWIVSAAALVAAGATTVISVLTRQAKIKEKFNITPFKFRYYQNKEKQRDKNDNEAMRFLELNGSIIDSMAAYNDYMSLYTVSSNEPQYFRVSYGEDLLKFQFEKSNADLSEDDPTKTIWSLKVYRNADENPIVSIADISQVAKTNMLDASEAEDIFGSHGIYVINGKLRDDDTAKYDLTNYSILISTIELSNWTENIQKAIKAYCETRSTD